MRGKLKKAVLKQFSQGISALCPGFELFQKEHDSLGWRRKIGGEFIFAIMIWADSRDDKFRININWSDDEDNWFSPPGHLDAERRRDRGDLWQLIWRKPGIRPGFDLDPELTAFAGRRFEIFQETGKWPEPTNIDIALTRVGPLVADALDKIKHYAMPFFRKVAETHHLVWPEDLAELYPQSFTPPSRSAPDSK